MSLVVFRAGIISDSSLEPSTSACPMSAMARNLTWESGPTVGAARKEAS